MIWLAILAVCISKACGVSLNLPNDFSANVTSSSASNRAKSRVAYSVKHNASFYRTVRLTLGLFENTLSRYDLGFRLTWSPGQPASCANVSLAGRLPPAWPGSEQATLVGSATISGVECDKYAYAVPNVPHSDRILFVAKKRARNGFMVPVRMIQNNLYVADYTDFKPDVPDSNVFDVPKGLRCS